MIDNPEYITDERLSELIEYNQTSSQLIGGNILGPDTFSALKELRERRDDEKENRLILLGDSKAPKPGGVINAKSVPATSEDVKRAVAESMGEPPDVADRQQPTSRSLQLAATAWCKPGTKNKVMDPELAGAFAEILDEQATSSGNSPYSCFQQTLREDQSYANVWHDNIACNALDAGVGHDTANYIASRVMKHCFDVETKIPAERGEPGQQSFLTKEQRGQIMESLKQAYGRARFKPGLRVTIRNGEPVSVDGQVKHGPSQLAMLDHPGPAGFYGWFAWATSNATALVGAAIDVDVDTECGKTYRIPCLITMTNPGGQFGFRSSGEPEIFGPSTLAKIYAVTPISDLFRAAAEIESETPITVGAKHVEDQSRAESFKQMNGPATEIPSINECHRQVAKTMAENLDRQILSPEVETVLNQSGLRVGERVRVVTSGGYYGKEGIVESLQGPFGAKVRLDSSASTYGGEISVTNRNVVKIVAAPAKEHLSVEEWMRHMNGKTIDGSGTVTKENGPFAIGDDVVVQEPGWPSWRGVVNSLSTGHSIQVRSLDGPPLAMSYLWVRREHVARVDAAVSHAFQAGALVRGKDYECDLNATKADGEPLDPHEAVERLFPEAKAARMLSDDEKRQRLIDSLESTIKAQPAPNPFDRDAKKTKRTDLP